VALVTGASKNIGKGMALEVAASGATTYLTARTLADTAGAPGSLERTASEIEAAGGRAVPLACDHGDDEQVEAVFDRIADDQGRLDVVVNVASPDFSEMVGIPFWERPLDDMSRCLDIGPRSNYATTVLAARRFMIAQRSGVVINVSSHGAEAYLLSVSYGAGKAAIDRITRDTALELKPHGVAVVSLWPGLVLTEGLLANTTVTEDGRRQLHGLDIGFGESPKFNGKAVVALAADPDILGRSGGSYRSSRLAREYGFAEDDGTLPPELPDGLASLMDSSDIPDYWRGVERYAGSQEA
jgi:NAD(P)-dependent dehydrogenase (short-subunit alcohol dehydrogenase family)